ncbi:hypothetical protein HMI54_012958 [Coelomomyces lativittatus]|nr:hypothetical protein HMI56_007247 [Coelomomyces lativittatus]KAJ1515552.1 hypothetical protein HMI55_003574 [Coelomomyces lativittatus]KAJ1518660.1 hypothetical protein HMI54_012958 [Coelomomyces lativittatus]
MQFSVYICLFFLTLLYSVFLNDNSIQASFIPLLKRLSDQIDNEFLDLKNPSANKESFDYIIQLRPELTSIQVQDHIKWLQSLPLDDQQLIKVKHTYDFGAGKFKGYTVRLPSEMTRVLASLPQIISIEKDVNVSTTFTIQQSEVLNWGPSRIWQKTMSFLNIFRFWSSQGSDVDVYIVDSGIYTDHLDFGGRAKEGVSFADNPTGDQNGHGTHVAGIVGGLRFGVAKLCTLISVKVLNSNGVGPYSSIIAGLNWIYNITRTSGRPSVINLSVSGPKSTAVNAAIEACVAGGIHVAVAAGNANTDACLSTPSSASGVVVAGSMNMYMRMSAFSNWGTCVSFLAPGEVIVSAGITALNATRAMSGTSMASPHVAGAIAMILSEVRMGPARMSRYLMGVISKNLITDMKNNTFNGLLYLNESKISVDDVLALTA